MYIENLLLCRKYVPVKGLLLSAFSESDNFQWRIWDFQGGGANLLFGQIESISRKLHENERN